MPRHPFASPEIKRKKREFVRAIGPMYVSNLTTGHLFEGFSKSRGLTLAKRVNHKFQRLHPVFAPLWLTQPVTPESGPLRRDTRNICRLTKS
jgi:hypothetical protein